MMKGEKCCEEALVEMFKRVGRTYPDEAFTNNDGWYAMEEWTEAEAKDFRAWLVAKARKDLKLTKEVAETEAAFFDLMWGWKIKEAVDEKE